MAKDIFFYYGVFSTIITLTNIIGNTLTVVAFVNDKSLRVNPSNNLILALSVTDLLYGMVVFVFITVPFVFSLGYPYGEGGCMALVTGANLYVVGNLLLVAISVDRILLVAINDSKYVKFQTFNRMKIYVVVCYSIGLAAALLELSLWKHAKNTLELAAGVDFSSYCVSPSRFITWFGTFYSLGLFCVPALTVAVLSAVFFYLLYARIKKTRQIGSTTAGNSGGSSRAGVPTQSSNIATASAVPKSVAESRSQGSQGMSDAEVKDEGRDNTKNRYIKPAVTLAVLVLSMVICLLPYCFYLVIGIFCPNCNNTTVRFILLLFVQMNPMLDPIFYASTQRNIRKYYMVKCSKIYRWFRP